MLQFQVNCPYCHKSLMDDEHRIKDSPSVTLLGKMPPEQGSAEGLIRLSAFYGDFSVDSAVAIPKDTIVAFHCPYCRHHLTSTRICDICSAPMVALEFKRGGRVQFCSRRGCKKHLIEFEDPEAELLAFYREYSPYME